MKKESKVKIIEEDKSDLKSVQTKNTINIRENMKQNDLGVKNKDCRGMKNNSMAITCPIKVKYMSELNSNINSSFDKSKDVKNLNLIKSNFSQFEKNKHKDNNHKKREKTNENKKSVEIKSNNTLNIVKYNSSNDIVNGIMNDQDFNYNMNKNFYKIVDENDILNQKYLTQISINNKLNTDIRTNELKLKSVETKYNDLILENKKYKEDIEKIKEEFSNYKKEVKNKELKNSDLKYLEIENDHLKFENIKLFDMLKQTDEYKNFAETVDSDHKLKYLKDIDFYKYVKESQQNSNNSHKSYLINKKLNDLLWVPEECFKFLYSLSLNEKINISSQMIEYILFELNKYWKARETHIISKSQIFCQNCAPSTKIKTERILSTKLPNEEKDKKIVELERELCKIKTRLSVSQKVNRNLESKHFNDPMKNLSHVIKLIESKNKNLINDKNHKLYLSEVNKVLKKQIDGDNLVNSYKILGFNEYGIFMRKQNEQ